MVLSLWLLSMSFVLGAEDEPGAATPTPATAAVPAFRGADHVAVLTVRGEIDGVTEQSLERRIRQATDSGADAIVLEIDTKGGRLDATLDICTLLKDPSITPPNTVAWIRPEAYSAGTIIALACREIVVAPNATFGDAAPISPFGPIPQTERAKLESPILSEVIDSARRNHYDENLVTAFIGVGVELWLIENVDTGERCFVDRAEYERVFGETAPQQMTPVAPPPAAGTAPRKVKPWFNTTIPQPPPDQTPGLTEAEIREQIEFQQQRPPVRLPLTEADRDQWKLVMQVVTSDRLLTVKQAEALYYGLAVAPVANDQQLKAFFGAQTLTRQNRSWSESLVRVLVSWPVRIVLIVIFLLALFIELAVPGVGVFGATAVVALLVLIGAPWLAGMAQWWDILLIVVGLLLVGAEVFVIPGFGVAGVAGAICLLAGIVGTFVTGDITTPQGQDELFTGVISTLTALFAGGVGIWLVSRQLKTVPFFNRLVLKAEVAERGGRPEQKIGLLEAMGGPQRALAVGDVGVAATDLRPAGRGQFDDRMVDVQSPGRYIEKGRPIRVLSVGRYVIEVEETDT